MTEGQVILCARGLDKSYRMGRQAIPVIKSLDLELRQGEVLGIVGKSGEGKSTLLNILGLLDRQDAGEIELLGQPYQNLTERQRSLIRNQYIGFIFQFYHLLPDLTALENVCLPFMIRLGPIAWRRHRPAIQREATRLLEVVGLKHRLTHRPGQLSGGERQRVAIARALVHRPPILLCDEPTGNLDEQTGREIQDLLLGALRDFARTLVLVTHDLDLVRRADRVLNMRGGRLHPLEGTR